MSEEIVRSLSVHGLRYGYRVLPRAAQPRAAQPRAGLPDAARQGEGPGTQPVVVLGGALQGMYGWPQMDDHLGPVADVITADLPGMGTADPLPPGPGAGILRDAVTRIIDDIGAPEVNLFGFSYGAAIAFDIARHHPGRIARLVLGGVPAHISDGQRGHWGRATARLAAGDAEGFAALAADGLLCLDPDRRVHRRELARRYVRRSFLYALSHSPHAADSLRRALRDRPDFSGGLSGVRALVFAGEHDTVTSARRQREFASTIEGSRFLTIGESDHWVVLERPDDVAELVTRFFTDRPLEPVPGPAVVPHQIPSGCSAPSVTRTAGGAPAPGRADPVGRAGQC